MSELWTPKEIATAQTMRANGEENATIAAKLGRTSLSVRKKLIALGSPKRERALSWSPADDDALRNMRARGMHYHVIASRMGRSIKAVESRALRIGVPPVTRPVRRIPVDHVARTGVADAALSPFGYDPAARAWAISNRLNPEALLIRIHLAERGEMRMADALAGLPKRKITEHRSA